jgi:CBS domain containing-hemolysin-like protein
MDDWLTYVNISLALLLVVVNGFFVAAEFALVRLRGGQLDALKKTGRVFGGVAYWLGQRLDASLSCCQLGVTIASLGLGWVGEPAFAALVEPLLHSMGVTSETAIHTTSFAFAFTTITALHLVIGEQAPKIFAIRKPEQMILWCAPPLAIFYFVSFPLLIALNWITSVLLRLVGVGASGEHDSPHTEEEIRALVAQAHAHGELTGSEHSLINAVFEFDDLICRRVMVPRSEVVFFKVGQPVEECLAIVQESRHSRFPVCDDSLDNVVGILHIKDLVGIDLDSFDIAEVSRPAHHIPESYPISSLLRHFQSTHQLMAIVDDEHGTVVGIVMLENVLEQIVGSVEDEFDHEEQVIAGDGANQHIVLGSAPLNQLRAELGLSWKSEGVDTLSGYITSHVGRVAGVGEKFKVDDVLGEVLEMAGTRITKVRLTILGASEKKQPKEIQSESSSSRAPQR